MPTAAATVLRLTKGTQALQVGHVDDAESASDAHTEVVGRNELERGRKVRHREILRENTMRPPSVGAAPSNGASVAEHAGPARPERAGLGQASRAGPSTRTSGASMS